MGRYILAVHAGHNASACIGDRTGILHAVQEERLNGEKNFWGVPRLAIRACLDRAGADAGDLDCIALGGKQLVARYHSRDDVIKAYRRQGTFSGKLRQRVAMPLVLALKKDFGQAELRQALEELGLGHVATHHHDHHLCHAASAYYGLRDNPNDDYLVLTCDGAGDGLCASVRIFGHGRVQEVSRTSWADSLGALYSWITFGMGFVPLEHEYKLMGMAPYASEQAAVDAAKVFEKYLRLDESGLGFARTTIQRTNDIADRIFDDLKGMRFDHICAGLQRFTEDILCAWTRAAVLKTGVRRVLGAGGVFMNVKANKRIAELDEVDYFEAFPSCGDETLPFGVYYLEAAERYGHAEVKPLPHFYFGDDLDERETVDSLRATGLPYERPADMASAVADLLVTGRPVARCAGPMEFGARALGNRSILADPKNSDVVRVINQMVKKRDFWMPFAPMVKAERQDEYLINPKRLKSPYMMMTFDTRSNFRDFIAAVHNADLTCRAQILERHQNQDVHDILSAFEARTGRGVILNTSFNLHGYPIVRTAKDALHVFVNSGLEHMQVGSYLVRKH